MAESLSPPPFEPLVNLNAEQCDVESTSSSAARQRSINFTFFESLHLNMLGDDDVNKTIHVARRLGETYARARAYGERDCYQSDGLKYTRIKCSADRAAAHSTIYVSKSSHDFSSANPTTTILTS